MDKSMIFISYRRDDSWEESYKIENIFKKNHKVHVFRDVSNIQIADYFPSKIKQAINESNYMLILIGRKWLNARDSEDNLRLNDPRDFVRREILYGLKRRYDRRQLIDIIPVLIQGAKMPKESELPEDINKLAGIDACRVTYKNFELDIKNIWNNIERIDEMQRKRADEFLDEIDELADFSGGLDKIVSIKPSASANPYLRTLPELASWNCSITDRGKQFQYWFETSESLFFYGERILPGKVKIEGTWRINLKYPKSLEMVLTGNTIDGEDIVLTIPIDNKVGEKIYTGKDSSGTFYRLVWIKTLMRRHDDF